MKPPPVGRKKSETAIAGNPAVESAESYLRFFGGGWRSAGLGSVGMVGVDGERNKDFRWRCRGCKKMYTVRTGIVLEESRLPVRVWVFAFWKACASKKGISALQLSREMEITHRSALFVLRRIRFAMDGHGAPLIGGKGRTVEIDETYVGGKPPAFAASVGKKPPWSRWQSVTATCVSSP